MNYVAYKQIDGTITSGFKVKLYDIVTLNTGYWKDKLAICLLYTSPSPRDCS